MRTLILFLPALLLLGVGCVEVRSEPPSVSVSESGAVTEVQSAVTLEDVSAMTVPQDELIVDSRFELAKHTTYFAASPDGIDWTLRDEPIARYASVPELVALEQSVDPFPVGTLLAYFVDGTQDHGREDVELGLAYSLDNGQTWSDRLYTTMAGMPDNTVAVDPSIVQLDDGRLRLYYYDFPAMPPPGTGRQPSPSASLNEFHTAISTDGINFVYEGLAYSSPSIITDPDIVAFGGVWRMYFMSHTDQSMAVSVSEDPTSFSSSQTVNDNGIPGVIVVGDEVWLFSCGQGGITRLTSKDGVTFTMVDPSVVSVSPGIHCDPSPTRLSDGSYGMVLKHIRAQDVRPMGQL